MVERRAMAWRGSRSLSREEIFFFRMCVIITRKLPPISVWSGRRKRFAYNLNEFAFASRASQPTRCSIPFITALMAKDALAIYSSIIRHVR